MKRVIDINNLIEAHMLADALREQGIEPILQGETAYRDLGQPIAITFSFQSDDVADKQIVYEDGRRVRIEYDRNRDGDFEEMYVLNEFEEVVEIRRDNR